MPIPQVTDRIKEAPAMALRAVFAGIGQLLMAVDKIRAQMQEQATSSTVPGQQRPSAAQPPRADGTSNVTPLRERATPAAKPGAGPDGTKPGAAAAAEPSASAQPASESAVAREPAAAEPAPSAAAAPAAPIPGYDDLSVASLRARLRGLDAAGVRALLDYEKANARRDDVITMFERRLSKIENGAS
jgi:hypothetical protein